MPYTTQISTKWFPTIRNSVAGLETTIRGDGAYDGDYRLIKAVWLIERDSKRERYSAFDAFWKALSPTSDDVASALANPESEFFHLLYCGLAIGRPISRHPLCDHMDDVIDYRDHNITDGNLTFYVYECSDILESPSWRRIARIKFNISDGAFLREHVADLDPNRSPAAS